MKNKTILSIGTMYMDINCVNFPFDTALFAHRETVGKQYELELGGSALNFAKIATQLAMEVSFVGKAGNDVIGNNLVLLMEQNKITPLIIFDDKVQTNLAIHYIHSDGTSIMTSCGDANQTLSIEDIEKKLDDVIDTIGYLYLGGVFKLKRLLPDLEHVVKKAKAHGITIVLDHGRVNNEVTPADIAYVKKLLPFVDIYLPSLDEFLAIWNCEHPEEGFSKLKQLATPLTVIKQAEKGAICFTDNKLITVDAYKVHVTNTVGAGDSFNAGFLKAYSEGKPLQASIQYACAIAAIKISTSGEIDVKKVSNLEPNS